MKLFGSEPRKHKYPGIRVAMDGNTAVVHCERESTDAAGAFPITPSTQMGEGWAENAANGHVNVSGRPLIFIEPEGEHAAAAVTAGLSMTGLRAANFSSGQGLAYMHESLYAAVGKRLTYVLNVGARAMTKATLNVHAGHDDYHCVDDTGFFQMFAKDAQHAADLNLAAHRIAELALTPGIVAQDGFLTTHLIESLLLPERALIEEYLGHPHDLIDTPTEGQRVIYGDQRRRIPELWTVDDPIQSGLVQNQDAYMQSVAAQRPFFFDHVRPLADRAFEELHELTGRRYARVMGYRVDDAEYLILGQGSVIPSAEAVADYLRETRKLRVGVVNLLMYRPFPGDQLSRMLQGKKGVTVLERVDQPLAADLPLIREVRSTLSKCLENGRGDEDAPFVDLASYRHARDCPATYSGSFGLGSRDLQPEGLIAAVENMLPSGAKKRFFYLSIDFAQDPPPSPKSLIHQERIARGYPNVRELALRGSENPNLMPEGSVTVRLHSIGGWGAITTGKNLAMTLFDLLGQHVKANPKYGSEKKGQPTTYYLSAAPEPIKVNCEYFYVDVVLSPDPNVFQHTNALAGLREEGVFVLQSDAQSDADVWRSLPAAFRRVIVDKRIRLFVVDAFAIARQEASDPDLQLRMQGIAFQGAFFRASGLLEREGLSEERLLEAIRRQIQAKFGAKGARVVEDNLRVIHRGFDEVRPIEVGSLQEVADDEPRAHVALPVLLDAQPGGGGGVSDVHRFWAQTGSLYARGQGNDQIADPFISLGTMPAASAIFRDMSSIRFEHPEWIPGKCTACGDCYTVCPDTAIPGLVSEIGGLFETGLRRVRAAGPVEHLPRALRSLEKTFRALLKAAAPSDSVEGLLDEAMANLQKESNLQGAEGQALADELSRFREALGGYQLARTRVYFDLKEKQEPGSGGLFNISVNPNTCKGCMECVQVCKEQALRPVAQTRASSDAMKKRFETWLDMPSTPERYFRIEDLEQADGVLHTLLLDKRNYLAVTSGDGACLGCSEKTVVRLFVATVEALMRPRVEKHRLRLANLIERLEGHVRSKLADQMTLGDSQALSEALSDLGDQDVTLARLAARLDPERHVVDRRWLDRVTDLLSRLRRLARAYERTDTRRGRCSLGLVNSTGCSSVWGSTYPYNPYPFPWTNHLFQDSPSIALGVFEGHAAKMADGFRTIRQAELELAGEYRPDEHDERLQHFNWEQFSDEEWQLCPPVVAMGGDGAMYDIGFQNLSRLMMAGKPIKVVVLDTQVYSNTGGQACTSGFLGQVSDMAQYGKAAQGKKEVRKEIGLIAMAHRTTYVMQSTIAHPSHLIEGFIAGLKARRPALFNLYTACQPEHGIADDRGAEQARLAVESRAYPLFRYDPDRGTTPSQCLDLSGNPAPGEDHASYALTYREYQRDKSLQVPMTFADFALTEGRFRKHFRSAPPDTWNDSMLPLADYLGLSQDERHDKLPYVWTVNREGRLGRLMVDEIMVASSEDRRDFWRVLRSLAGLGESRAPSEEAIVEQVRTELAARLSAGILQLAGLSAGDAGPAAAALAHSLTAKPNGGGNGNGNGRAADANASRSATPSSYEAPWIESDKCTSCDECVTLYPLVFAYDENKHAFVKNAGAGNYEDFVRAAERCTAGVIHPGRPEHPTADGMQRLIERARPFD